MSQLNLDVLKNNQELIKYLGGTAAIGFIGYYIYRKFFRTKYRYPVEIIFNKYGDSSLGITKEKFIANLEKNHELYLLILQRIYPNECTLNLGRSSIFSLLLSLSLLPIDLKILYSSSFQKISWEHFLECMMTNCSKYVNPHYKVCIN